MGAGGVEPGGSDDGMTITICSFFALQVCVFAELDNCTLWTVFMGYIKHCAV